MRTGVLHCILLYALMLAAGHQSTAPATDSSSKKCDNRVQIPIATNRSVTPEPKSPEDVFGDAYSADEHFAAAVVETCDQRALPILSLTKREDAKLYLGIGKSIEEHGLGGMFVPGYNTSVPVAVSRMTLLQLHGGMPNGSLLASWATGGVFSYRDAQANIGPHSEFVEKLLAKLLAIDSLGNGKAILYCHSLGCAILLRALDNLGKASPGQRLLRKIRRIVMLAPDVSVPDFKQQHARISKYVDFGTTIYVADTDRVFSFADKLSSVPMTLGAGAIATVLGDRVEVVNVSDVLPKLIDLQNYSVNFSLNHDYGFTNPVIRADMRWAIAERKSASLHRLPVGPPDSNTFQLRP
jgi:alpha/beta hydrolase family protein DUF900